MAHEHEVEVDVLDTDDIAAGGDAAAEGHGHRFSPEREELTDDVAGSARTRQEPGVGSGQETTHGFSQPSGEAEIQGHLIKGKPAPAT